MICVVRRTPGRSLRPPRPMLIMPAMTARCEPETATRCVRPRFAKSLLTGYVESDACSPRTTPATRARPGSSRDSMASRRYARIRRIAPTTPRWLPSILQRFALMPAAQPRASNVLPHSLASGFSQLPTRRTRRPMRSGSRVAASAGSVTRTCVPGTASLSRLSGMADASNEISPLDPTFGSVSTMNAYAETGSDLR